MNTKYIFAALISAALLTTPAFAQDMPAEEPDAPAVVSEDRDAAVPDEGEELRLAAQDAPVAEPTPKRVKTAEEKVKAELSDKNGPFKFSRRLGYQKDKKVIAQVGVATFRCDDISAEDFLGKRDIKALEAYLSARAAIGRSIINQFSAIARSAFCDPDDPDPKVQAAMEKRQEIEERKAQLASKIAEMDSAKAAQMRGVTIDEKFGKLLDGIIKKLDDSYDPAVISQEKMDRYNALKAEAETLKAECSELEKLAEQALPQKNADRMTQSQVTANLRFFGCVAVAQAESWNPATKQYQVAVGVIWSMKLHEKARAAFDGNLSLKGKPGKQTFDDWFETQLEEKEDDDGRPFIPLGAMVGSRLFTDAEGLTYFVGIGGAKVPEKAVQDEGLRAEAVENARIAAMFSLKGEGIAQRNAARHLSEYNDNTTQFDSKMINSIALEIKNSQVEGMDEGSVEKVVNPLSGQEMYVAVLTINPYLAAESEEMQDLTAAGAIEDERTNQLREGRQAGREAAIDAARRDRSAYQQGVREGGKGVSDKLQKNAGTATGAASDAGGSQAPRGGVSSAGTDWEMDF